jgi:uncharacterized protein YcbX
MTLRLAHICRHPIKSAGFETLESVALSPGRALPLDREWAIAHDAAGFGRALDAWAPKRNFLRGVAGPELMAIACETDAAARRVSLHHPRAGRLDVAPDDPADAARLIDWITPLWPEGRPAPAFVATLPGQALTDWPDPFVSILNLASNRALGERLGQDLSIHRWRGNLWLDGLPPFGEFDLVGRTLRIGTAELSVRQAITRCKATSVNPATGVTDADTLGALRQGWGHEDFGVYAVVTAGGTIAVGQPAVLVH